MMLANLTLVMWIAAAAPTAGEPSDPQVRKAKAQLESLDPQGALRTLEAARVRLQDAPRSLAEVYLYIGLAHASLADQEKAIASFRAAKLLWPDVALPPDVSPKVQDWWAAASPRAAEQKPRQPEQVDAGVVEPPPAAEPSTAAANPSPPPSQTPRANPPWTPGPAAAAAKTGATPGRPPWAWWTSASLLGASSVALSTSFFVGREVGTLTDRARAERHIGASVALVEEARSRALVSNVLLGAAVASATGAALVFFFSAPEAEDVPRKGESVK